MFRTAARGFATSARRGAEIIGSAEAQQTALNISKAQGIGQRGFLDGNIFPYKTPERKHIDIYSQQLARPLLSA